MLDDHRELFEKRWALSIPAQRAFILIDEWLGIALVAALWMHDRHDPAIPFVATAVFVCVYLFSYVPYLTRRWRIWHRPLRDALVRQNAAVCALESIVEMGRAGQPVSVETVESVVHLLKTGEIRLDEPEEEEVPPVAARYPGEE